ncbi:hypothetical protein IBB3154_0762 [Ligilactobacillus salivarius]|uniref:hypothetical protein n=1 Tax=Ligilactobacillus salivarius TaxID=1624 RepID=UPI0013DE71B9|nr:hypothetical protein [Ligilactobacillus salivarius]QIG36253.1 hypothetical protein IBB3154_0762 [Ligilactobacillus salivarius]
MTLTTEFRDAVQNKNVISVKIMLKDSLLLNGENFKEMLEYAKEQIPSLIDEHDGEIFKPETEWDEDYLNEQLVVLVNNFSEERIKLLQSIIHKLYGKQTTNEADLTKSLSTDRELTSLQKKGTMVATAGTATFVTGLAGLAMKMSWGGPVTLVGGAAVIVGSAMYKLGKEN